MTGPAPVADMYSRARFKPINSLLESIDVNSPQKRGADPAVQLVHLKRPRQTERPTENSGELFDPKIEALIKPPEDDEYDLWCEDTSSIPICRPSFDQLCELLTSMRNNLLAIIDKHQCEQPVVEVWRQMIQAKCLPPCPKTLVGFEGAAGVGKSSTINSVIHGQDVATVGHDGSETLAPHEYHLSEENNKFWAEVELHTPDECKSRFNGTMRDIIAYLNLAEEDKDPDPDNRPPAELLEEALVKYTSGLSAFEDMGFLDGSSFQELSSFVEKNKDKPESLYRLVEDYVDTALQQECNRAGKPYEASFAEDNDLESICIDKVKSFLLKYTQQPERERGANHVPVFWPFVKVVRWYIPEHFTTPLLKHGIVPVDLTGASDPNVVRQRTSEDALQRCGARVVISRIDRVADDRLTHTLLVKAADHFRGDTRQKVLVVCTRADDVDDNLSIIPKTFGEKVSEALAIRAYQQRCEKALKNASRATPRTEKKKLQITIDQCARKCKEISALHRNKSAAEAVQAAFKKSTTKKDYSSPENIPKAFCVSNKEYKSRRDNKYLPSPTFSSTADTGIPAFHNELLRLASEVRLPVIKQHVTFTLPYVLLEITLHCAKLRGKSTDVSHPQMDQSLRGTLSSEEDDILLSIEEELQKARRLADEFFAALYSKEQSWREKAEDTCKSWANFKYKTFLAHCTRKGVLKLKGARKEWQEPQTLLEQLLELPGNHIGRIIDQDKMINWWRAVNGTLPLFTEFVINFKAWKRSSATAIKSRLQAFQRKIKGEMLEHDDQRQLCLNKLDLRISNFVRQMNSTIDNDIIPDFDTSVRKATVGNEHSYLYKDLEPMFEAAVAVKGLGAHEKRVHFVATHLVDSEKAFVTIRNGIRKDFGQALNRLEETLLDQVRSDFAKLREDLGRQDQDNVVDNQSQLMEELGETALEWADRLKIDGQRLLKEIEDLN